MLFSLLYMMLRSVLRLAPGGGQRDREIEILVLRQQVQVLQRKAGRPKLRRRDRHVEPVEIVPKIKRRDLLGGLIHEYYPVAA